MRCATISVRGSARSTRPRVVQASVNAADISSIISGSKAWFCKNRVIGTTVPQVLLLGSIGTQSDSKGATLHFKRDQRTWKGASTHCCPKWGTSVLIAGRQCPRWYALAVWTLFSVALVGVIPNDAGRKWGFPVSGSGSVFEPKTILTVVNFIHSHVAEAAVKKKQTLAIKYAFVGDPRITNVGGLMGDSGGIDSWKAVFRDRQCAAVDGGRNQWSGFKFRREFLFADRKIGAAASYVDDIQRRFFPGVGKIYQNINRLPRYQFAIETSANWSNPRTLVGSHLSQLIYQDNGLDSQNGGGYRYQQ